MTDQSKPITTDELELSAPNCEVCGAPNAGASVDGTALCGDCASEQLTAPDRPDLPAAPRERGATDPGFRTALELRRDKRRRPRSKSETPSTSEVEQ